MSKKVMEIKSVIERDGDKDVIEYVVAGDYYIKKGIHYLIYEETELTGMEGMKTMVRINGDTVLIKRYSEGTNDLAITLGESEESFYRTPYGIFDMVTYGRKLSVRADEEGGTIHFTYDLTIKGLADSYNELTIKVK